MTTLLINDGPVAEDAAVRRTGGVPLTPAGTAWPECAVCGGPMQFLAHLPRQDMVLSVFMCQQDPGGCDEWDATSGGNRVLVFPAAEVLAPLAVPVPDWAGQDDGEDDGEDGEDDLDGDGDGSGVGDVFDEDDEDEEDEEDEDWEVVLGAVTGLVAVEFEDGPGAEPDETFPASVYLEAGKGWAAATGRPVADVLGQWGGAVPWIQGDQTPDCPGCARPMGFVAALDEGLDHESSINFGGGGEGYVFACDPCAEAAFLWQC